MIAFIDDHPGAFGVEPICRVLAIAPSTYHAHIARRADPARQSERWWSALHGSPCFFTCLPCQAIPLKYG
jgi:hypothetical protein